MVMSHYIPLTKSFRGFCESVNESVNESVKQSVKLSVKQSEQHISPINY